MASKDSHEPHAAVYVGPPVGLEIKARIESIYETREQMPIFEKLGGLTGVAASLHVDLAQGVSSDTVEHRRAAFGKNELPPEEPVTFLQILLAAWSDHMIIVLTIAACVSLILGLTVPHPGETEVDRSKGWIEGFAVILSVLIVTTVSSVNDYRKELKFRKLTDENNRQEMNVLRDGKRVIVDVSDLVVGDLMEITPGLVVPTDGFYVSGQSVVIDESSATGESDPKKKSAKAPFFMSGTVVNTAESAVVLVCAVGENSFGGRLLMASRQEGGPRPTPLQERLDDMADNIGKIGVTAAVILFTTLSIIEIVRFSKGEGEGTRFLDYFLICVAIVVVAVPEGLPLAVTISLAYSQNKMRKDNNQVRRLKACEIMGNATTICSDKTGTLTKNLMSVVQVTVGEKNFQVTAPGGELVKIDTGYSEKVVTMVSDAIALCSSSEKEVKDVPVIEGKGTHKQWRWENGKGNKTDNALLDFSDRVALSATDATSFTDLPHQRCRAKAKAEGLYIFPFTSERKKMSVIVKSKSVPAVHYVKGGSDVVLPLCTSVMTADGEIVAINDRWRQRLEEEIAHFANDANRTVGVAFANLKAFPTPEESEVEPVVGLTWLALLGIQDPLRDEVPDAVAKCQRAGVVVRMCTGDNLATAVAISKKCGIYDQSRGDIALEGKDFREMVYDAYAKEFAGKEGHKEFTPVLDRLRILARSQPMDKQLLVLMLMLRGDVVAVTGDGTNDAPALRMANVGFVMKSGTDIAVKSADIVLLDDNFRSVQRAVVWGRCVNDNIRKFLQLQLCVNVVAVFLTFIGSLTNTSENSSPLSTVQLLWINLIMDTFAALGLATEEPNEACLDRGPINRKAPLLSRRMFLTIGVVSMYQLVVTLVVFNVGHTWFGLGEYKIDKNPHYTVANLLVNPNIPARVRVYDDGKFSIIHRTIVFNIFVWSVIFNQFNARKLYGEVNIFEGFGRSKPFFVVLIIEIIVQVLAVETFRDFMKTRPLDYKQWLACIGLALLVLPIAVLSRLIPVPEKKYSRDFDPEDIDEDARAMLDKLQDEIKVKLAAKAADEAAAARAGGRSPRFLWNKARRHLVDAPRVVTAFRRAHVDGGMKTQQNLNSYRHFKTTGTK